MILFKVTHKYRLDGHLECKNIGLYSCEQNAQNAVEELKQKPGFCDTKEGFKIKKVFKFFKSRLINKTFWIEGFVTYKY